MIIQKPLNIVMQAIFIEQTKKHLSIKIISIQTVMDITFAKLELEIIENP